MNILEILKLLFTKIGEQESISAFIDSLLKIPKALKNALCIVLFFGFLYFCYSKIFSYDIKGLQAEVTELKATITNTVQEDTYSDDIYYIITAISICEEVNKYAYEEEQLQLELIQSYMKRHNPDDPIIVDIQSMRERNEFNYNHYSSQFKKAISKCKIRNLKNTDISENEDTENIR